MRGDLLDVILVIAALLFAVSGYRQGFVVGALSFIGFLGGGVLGAKIAPSIAHTALFDGFPEAMVGLAVVFIAATTGQVLATVLGAVDFGYRVVLATDALCSSSDVTHEALLTLYRERFDQQIETADAETILANWPLT